LPYNHIAELIRANASEIPDQTFLQFEDLQYTYRDIDRQSNQAARLFSRFGIRKGDHVALMLKNCPEYLAMWFGLAKLGAVMVPLNIYIKGQSLQYILDHSDSKLLVFDIDFADEIKKVLPSLTKMEQVWTLRDFNDEATKEKEDGIDLIELAKEDAMSIIYTSGTTGLPKGVVLSHYTYINTGSVFTSVIARIARDDVLYTCLPLFHCNAQQLSVMGTMLVGAKLALSERFGVSRFWEEIDQHKATLFNYIGSMLTLLIKQPESALEKNNTVRRAFGGGRPQRDMGRI
jgi:crotonobetaine/carnitine-CoA ligase